MRLIGAVVLRSLGELLSRSASVCSVLGTPRSLI